MKDNIKYWSVVGTVKQIAFREDGTTYDHEILSPIGEQHVLYNGVLMCGKSRNALKDKFKTKKQKTVQLRIENLPLCKDCEKKYKKNSNLAYQKWVASVSPALHGVKVVS